MVAFDDAHGAGKALFCHDAGFNGVPSHKSHPEIFCMEIFFIIGIQDTQRDTVGSADTDGVGDLPGVHTHETAKTRRNGDTAPDIKGESLWCIAEYAADSVGETAAQFIGQNHGCEKFLSAHIFLFGYG